MKEVHFSGVDGCALSAAMMSADAQAAVEDDRVVVLLHGGGPDHQSLIPLAKRITDLSCVILPDVRGYGRSICRDEGSHTWDQYACDVISLLDHLGIERAILGGTGLGTTISLRTAIAHPERVHALVLISIEDIEDDVAKREEIAFMEAFAERVRTQGIEAAWEPILPNLAPVINSMVKDAIPRSDPASIAAAAAIGRDRSFHHLDELLVIRVPTLIVPGIDSRHPATLGENLARMLPSGRLAGAKLTSGLRTLDDFAKALSPSLREFLIDVSNRCEAANNLRSSARAPLEGDAATQTAAS